MNTAKKVLERYHAKVPFPITPAKIRAAGYDVEQYLKGLICEIGKAADSQEPRVQNFLRKIHLMEYSKCESTESSKQ